MQPNPEHKRHERQDWGIVLVILLLGFCCVLFAGQWALRFAPDWQADTDMESNINLNSEFLTNKPSGFFEPLDPAILTQPGWMDLFLTPGADFVTGTPLPPPTATVATEPGTVPAATNTLAVTTSPTNTLVWFPPPATATKKPKPPPADTPTNTVPPPPPSADLQLTITDGVIVHDLGTPKTYTIVVSNTVPGSSNVIGATVTDNFPAQILTANWTCAGVGGGSCTAAGAGNINDAFVNLPVGSSVAYTVNVTTDAVDTADLVNTASVDLPVGYLGPTPVSATDTDTTAVPPPGSIGSSPDYNIYNLPMGSSLTLRLPTDIIANGDPAWDLVYYELENAGPPPYVLLDWVVIEISDGYNWYTVFYWGDPPAPGTPDTNTNVASFSPENDQFQIFSGPPLYNNTGIAIDVDSIVPLGIYPYIRFTSPTSGVGPDVDSSTDIDAVEVLP